MLTALKHDFANFSPQENAFVEFNNIFLDQSL